MDVNVIVSFDRRQDNWVIARVNNLCKRYEKKHELFSRPSHEKTEALLNFAREIAESVGFRSTGGEE